MALITTWLQGGTYTAAQDRHLVYAVTMGQPRVLSGLEITAPGPGDSSWSVNVAIGEAVVAHNNPDRIEATIVENQGGSVNWPLDPPDPGMQSNVTVGFGAIIGSGSGADLAAIGEIAREDGPIGHNAWGSMQGSAELARVVLVGGGVVPANITDRRLVMPLSGVVVSDGPAPSRLVPGSAHFRV